MKAIVCKLEMDVIASQFRKQWHRQAEQNSNGLASHARFDYDVLDGDLYPDSSYPVSRGLSPDALIGAIIRYQ
jgi:arginase family enzyme